MRTRDIVRSKWIFGIFSIALAVAFLMLLNRVAAQGTGNLTRITTASDSDRDSRNPRISADERVFAFQSDSDFLNTSLPDNQFEIWLFETGTMTYTRLTYGSETNRDSFRPSLSANGFALAFQSDSDFHVDWIPDNQNEIWFTKLRYWIYLPLVNK